MRHPVETVRAKVSHWSSSIGACCDMPILLCMRLYSSLCPTRAITEESARVIRGRGLILFTTCIFTFIGLVVWKMMEIATSANLSP